MEHPVSLKGVRKIGSLPSELVYGAIHLRRSFEQKRKPNTQEAQDFLSNLRQALPKQNPYFTECESVPIVRLVNSGFYNACFGFESSKGKWVIKIGHDKSPMKTKLHPATQEYAQSYLKNLEIQRSIFSNKLPHLIPEPQGVLYIKGQRRATTIVVQPFIDYVSPFDKKLELSQEECQQLESEFTILDGLIMEMRNNYGIAPDFMRARGENGHLVVVKKEDRVHLVMLDNGIFDENEDRTPALHFINRIITKKTMISLRKKKKV